MRLRTLAGLLFLLATLSLPRLEAAGAEDNQRDSTATVAEWNSTLEQIAKGLGTPVLTAYHADQIKAQLAELLASARQAKNTASAQIKPLNAELKALGPPPEADAPPELPDIAAQRERIGKAIATLQASLKQAELAIARANELSQATAKRSLRRSIEKLLKVYPVPLAPRTIQSAVPEFLRNLAFLAQSPFKWWQGLSDEQRERTLLYRFAIVILLAIGIGWAIRRALLHWFGRDATIEHPTYTRRLTSAIAAALAYGIVPSLILGGFLYRALDENSVITGLFSDAFIAICIVAIMFILAWALPRAVLAPDLPAWRLLSVTPAHARTISRRIAFLAAVFGIDLFFGMSSRSVAISDELIALYTMVLNSLEAVGVLALTQGALWITADSEVVAKTEAEKAAEIARAARFWTILRRLVGLIAIAVIVTALIGYANLSRYLSQNLVLSAMVVGALVLVRGLCRELIGMALRARLLRVGLGIPHRARNRTKFWLRALLDLTIYASGLLLALVIWGVPLSEVWGWTSKVLRGFTVGNVTISITDIAVALLIFLVVTALTRAVQRVMTERVFPQTGLDAGVRNSLSAGLGYVGIAIAATLAVSALGLDLANIAIIAGALSVGIGFGLQNIVNNFVSGLILLIERPIKVGDWIVVGGNEGHVKQINVRATEIETFQRASVIVPNSELLSTAVINWTHKDRYGRAEVSVGVAYGSDVDKVMEILRGCLNDHPDTLSWPKPSVIFQNFGDSSLDFDVRGYTANVERRIHVQSELRISIYRALAEAGIEIPFPQRDVHIKNLDQIKGPIRGADPATDG
ncbi:MAG: mechanosensitive ion channel domain-containing protein [Alphaproteobacteria bacterium]